ncbi:MAG: hypothetical protein U0235_26870 [Polyangiaceae bacterium]
MSDLDFQIVELRAALAAHERTMESQETALGVEIEKAGRDAEAIERELTALSDRVCEPLRARAELAPMLREFQTT